VRVGSINGINGNDIPDVYALYDGYPNPFNPFTTIRYDLPRETEVKLLVFDILGRQVKTLVSENQNAGYQSVQWNGLDDTGRPVGTGIYLYRIEAEGFVETRKLLFLK